MLNTTTLKSAKSFIIAGAAAFGLAFAAPAASAGDFTDISINNLDFDDEDFLQQLIAMDADDIADIREDMAEARADIREAIGDILEARAEAEADPQAKPVFVAAMAAASATVKSTTEDVFKKVRASLDDAETQLNSGSVDVSADEIEETLGVIAVLREELTGIEGAIAELVAAMTA